LHSKPTIDSIDPAGMRKRREYKNQSKFLEELEHIIHKPDLSREFIIEKVKPQSKTVLCHHNSSEEEKSAYVDRDFSKVQEMACYYPTEEEFRQPIIYFEKLFKEGAWKHGCIKIIPPSSFKPPFSFNSKSHQKMPFRSQTVQNLSKGKEFTYNKEGETYEDFKTKSQALEEKYFRSLQNLSEKERNMEIQKDYWNLVENHSSKLFDQAEPSGDIIKYEDGQKVFRFNYAADLPVNKYGSGFPTPEQDEEYGKHPFNFMNINDQEKSLLAFCKGKDISGINVPWFYIGMLYSSFCWHYEDLMMYSLNYMHQGAGKIWYSISPQHREKFEKVTHKKFKELLKEDPNFLLNINSMISPDYLTKNGVPVTYTHQKPGEFILTFPSSYHAGFSLGFNAAEAVNFAAPTWLPYAEKAMKIYFKSREKVPVIPMQWLILETDYKLPKYVSKEVRYELSARRKIRKEYEKHFIDPDESEIPICSSTQDDETKYE